MKNIYILLCLSILLILTACTNEKTGTTEPKHKDKPSTEEVTQHGGDIRESTKSANTLPTFLADHSEQTQTIYAAVAQNKELLEKMPCYCGCGDSVGHKDNYDCFIHEDTSEAITWDDHGTKCKVCLDIAAEAIVEKQNGKSDEEIRKLIDEKYHEGYAKPTPTPAVS